MCQTSTSPFAFAFTVAFPVLSLFSFSSLSSPLSNVAFLLSFLPSLLFLSLLLKNRSHYDLLPYNIADHQETFGNQGKQRPRDKTQVNKPDARCIRPPMASKALSTWHHEHHSKLSIWQDGP